MDAANRQTLTLYLDDQLVADIIGFSFETPWATGQVHFKNTALFKKLVAVTHIIDFDLALEQLQLNETEENIQWNEKVDQLSLSPDDFDLSRDGRWSISVDGAQAQPIYAVRFDASGFIDWR